MPAEQSVSIWTTPGLESLAGRFAPRNLIPDSSRSPNAFEASSFDRMVHPQNQSREELR